MALPTRAAPAALACLGVLLAFGCTTAKTEKPVTFKPPSEVLDHAMEIDALRQEPPYVREVYADSPLVHWRMNGTAEGAIEGDEDKATAFVMDQHHVLGDADFGGPEVALEFWTRDPSGDALTWSGEDGDAALKVTFSDTVRVSILDHEIDTGARIEAGRWHLVGISWRGDDGLAMVSIDGVLVWRGHAAKGRQLPYEGTLIAGGAFEGQLDEVAVFETFKYPATWLHRRRVALGLSAPSRPGALHTIRLETQASHSAWLSALAWSPDGTRFVSGGHDKTLKIWHASRGALLHTLDAHNNWISGVSWSPDGTRFVSSGSFDLTLKVWDAEEGALLRTIDLPGDFISSVAWSPDGSRIISGGGPGQGKRRGNLKIWDAHSGVLMRTIESEGGYVLSVAWSPDSTQVIAGSEDKTARIWSVGDGTLHHTLAGHTSLVESVAWSPDGKQVASGSFELKVWGADEGNFIQTIKASSLVKDAQWSPDGARIATCAADGAVEIWDAHTSEHLVSHKRDHAQKNTKALSWKPDSAQLAIGYFNGAIEVLDAHEGEPVLTLDGQSDDVSFVSWHPHGTRLASGSRTRTSVKVWDLQNGSLIRTLDPQLGQLTAMAYSPDGTRLASSHLQGVAVWQAGKDTPLLTFREGPLRLEAMSWSPDSNQVALVLYNKSVEIWDARAGTLLQTLTGHTKAIKSASWSPDGTLLATGSYDGTVKLWDTRTGTLHHDFTKHTRTVESVAWRPDGTLLASATHNGTVKIWDPVDGSVRRTLTAPTPVTWSLTWRPDGAQIAMSGGKGAAIWDAAGGAPIHTITDHKYGIKSVAWDASGTRIATGGVWDKTLKVWDASTFDLLSTHSGFAGDISTLVWSPDDTQIAGGGWDGAKIWHPARKTGVTLSSRGPGNWLIFDEEGFFDGSKGSGDFLALIQGHEVFSMEQIAPLRNRPDRVLASLDAPAPQRAFFKALWARRLKRLGLDPEHVPKDFSSAPTVKILHGSTPDDAALLQLQALFKDKFGLKSYQIYVNGVPTSPQPTPLEGKRQHLTLPVQLARGPNTVEIVATNAQGVESLRASMHTRHEGQGLPAPRLFYLGFGVSDYKDDRFDLSFAHQDAIDLGSLMSSIGGGYADIRAKTFTNAEVNDDVLSQARAFLSEVGVHDTLVMFIAGHGARDKDAAHTYYYLDHDASFDDLAGTAIPFEAIEGLLYASKARKKLFLMDTCQSGEDINLKTLSAPLSGVRGISTRSIRGALPWKGFTLEGEAETDTRRWLSVLRDRDRLIMQDLARRSGAIVLASSLGQESSLEAETWRNGAFTEEILHALRSGVADTNKDGTIDTDELKAYVIRAVPRLTGDRQHPNVERDNPHQKFSLPIDDAKAP